MSAVYRGPPGASKQYHPDLIRSGDNARFLKNGRLWSTWPLLVTRGLRPGSRSAVAAATAGGRSLA
jgi:hypothetical protein